MLLWERRKTASTAKVFLILFFFMHAPRVSYVILILLCMHVSSVSCCFVCMFRAILSDHLLQTLTSSGKNVIVTTWLSRFNKMSTDGKTPRLDPVGSYRHLLRAVNETLSILKHAIRVFALRILSPKSWAFWTSSQKSLVLRIQPPNLLALWYSLVFQLSSFKVVFQFWDFLRFWNKLLTFILRRNYFIVYILVSK